MFGMGTGMAASLWPPAEKPDELDAEGNRSATGRESRSTLGEEALDFRVRNGNGYDSLSMATGKRNAESTV